MTQDNGHTAGPWKAAAKPSSIVGWPVVAPHAGGRMICDVALAPKPADMSDGEWSRHYVEVEANARLIAAAPALLEALEGLVEVCEPNIYPQPDKPESSWAKLVAAKAALLVWGLL